jgi:NADH-quinone oxidoreductase subunit M
MIYAWVGRPEDARAKETALGTLLLESALLGTLCSLDLAMLLAFWILALLAASFLVRGIAGASGADRWLIAVTSLIAASALAVVIGFSSRSATLDLPTLSATPIPWPAQVWMFWVVLAVCGLTMAAFPLHLWYAAASRALPVTVRVLVGSLLLNLGGYGLIRLCVQLFPLASARFAPVVSFIGVIGILYGSLAALGQQSLPAAMAYWRIAQSGLIVVGVFALEDTGLHGAIVHLLACSLSAAALLMLCGAEAGERAVSSARPSARWHRLGMATGFLSAIGVPGTVGFLGQGTLVVQVIGGEWLASGGLVDWIRRIAVLVGLLLASAALLRVWRRAAAAGPRPLTQQTLVALALPVLILFLGLYPTLIADATGPTVFRVLEEARERVERDLEDMTSSHGVADAEPGAATGSSGAGIAWDRAAGPVARPLPSTADPRSFGQGGVGP